MTDEDRQRLVEAVTEALLPVAEVRNVVVLEGCEGDAIKEYLHGLDWDVFQPTTIEARSSHGS